MSTAAPLNRDEFEEMICELLVDKSITADELCDRILGSLATHHVFSSSTREKWMRLCELAWSIANASDTVDAPN